MIIDHQPAALQAFLAPFRTLLSKPQFGHFWPILLAWVVNVRRSVVWHLSRSGGKPRHRTSLGRFLTSAPWDGAKLLDQQVRRMLTRLRPRRGETLDLILDDTRGLKKVSG